MKSTPRCPSRTMGSVLSCREPGNFLCFNTSLRVSLLKKLKEPNKSFQCYTCLGAEIKLKPFSNILKSLITLILKLVYLILMQNTRYNRERSREQQWPGADRAAHCTNTARTWGKHPALPKTQHPLSPTHTLLSAAPPVSSGETTSWANSSLELRNRPILYTREEAPLVNEERKPNSSIISL